MSAIPTSACRRTRRRSRSRKSRSGAAPRDRDVQCAARRRVLLRAVLVRAELARGRSERTEFMTGFDYDVLIIGSGFGGSVAALRAAEKGYRVGVMESGRRWSDEDIPKTQWDLPGFFCVPRRRVDGVQRIEYLDDVLVLCGAGVGGGSHVYANTLYVPPRSFSMRRNGRASRTGPTNWLRTSTKRGGCSARRHPDPPTDVTGTCIRSRPRWVEVKRSIRLRWASTSAARASRPTTRTSAVPDPGGPDVSPAVTATTAAGTTPRTS